VLVGANARCAADGWSLRPVAPRVRSVEGLIWSSEWCACTRCNVRRRVGVHHLRGRCCYRCAARRPLALPEATPAEDDSRRKALVTRYQVTDRSRGCGTGKKEARRRRSQTQAATLGEIGESRRRRLAATSLSRAVEPGNRTSQGSRPPLEARSRTPASPDSPYKNDV
jgi:hypothetical protein